MVITILNSPFQLQSFLSQPYMNADILIYLSDDRIVDNVNSKIDLLAFAKIARFKRSFTFNRKHFLIASPIIRIILFLLAKSIIIGDIRSPYLVAVVPKTRRISKYLVDDGAVSIFNLYLNSKVNSTVPLNIGDPKKTSLSSLLLKFALSTNFLKPARISDFNLITMFENSYDSRNVFHFDPQGMELSTDVMQHITYEVFEGASFVLGGKYSEIGLMNEECYLGYLESIIKNRKGKGPIYYICHRGESVQKLFKVQSIGYIVFHCPSGCEAFFLEVNKCNIEEIIGFYTTALLIIGKYLRPTILLYFVDIQKDLADKSFIDSISIVYEFFYKNRRLRQFNC